jgi:hypothetical protein
VFGDEGATPVNGGDQLAFAEDFHGAADGLVTAPVVVGEGAFGQQPGAGAQFPGGDAGRDVVGDLDVWPGGAGSLTGSELATGWLRRARRNWSSSSRPTPSRHSRRWVGAGSGTMGHRPGHPAVFPLARAHVVPVGQFPGTSRAMRPGLAGLDLDLYFDLGSLVLVACCSLPGWRLLCVVLPDLGRT